MLDKVYVLVVSATPPTQQLPLSGRPTSPSPCQSFHQLSRSSPSEKVRSYPQLVHDYKQLRGSKSGLGLFDMLPAEEKCGTKHASPSALSRMIQLGEFLGQRYRQVWPWLQEAGKDPVVARSMPEAAPFQSVAALLHGLLSEKQFCRTEVKKLENHVRGQGSHQGCSAIADIELFVQQAYMQEKEIFKNKDSTFALSESVYHSLGVENSSTAKQVVRSLHQVLCEGHKNLCTGGPCVNLTQDSVHQLWEVISRHNAYLSSSPVFQSYAVADTARHVDKLLSWFSQPADAGPVLRVDVTDDYFFLKLLAAMGHRVQRPIVPTTRLVAEQYRKARSNSTATLWQVLVDGEVVTDSLGSCSGGAAKGLCGVDTMKAHLKQWAQSNMFGDCTGPKDEL